MQRRVEGRVLAGSGAQPGQALRRPHAQSFSSHQSPESPNETRTTGTARPHSRARGVLTHMMQPMDQMSTSKLCPFLPSTSGAM